MKNLKYIKYFKEISKKDLSRVGGKGANLGEMMIASLPVPDGFVLVVDSYNEFLSENNLYSKIDNILESININQFAEIEKGAKKIQDIFNDAKIPIEICAEIDKAYQKIGNSRVAVRSSATMEDSPETSFAGQFDSFLNVEGKEELYKNIKNCWGSLWNSRALSYRIKQNIGNDDLAHGVVVQKLIEAEKSGIIFTANPVNGRRDQLLLNSSWGLGESIVCGDVRADQWIIDKDSFDIIEKDIGSKEIMAVCKGDGTEYIVTPAAKRNQASLEEDEIIGLVKLAQKTEKHYGHPQDIEWAYHNGEFYLLQTRPITTLFPVSGIRDNNDGLRVYMNFMLNNQVMHEPLTPMGEETWKMAIKSTILNKRYRKESVSWLKSIAGRLFIDVTELSRFERCWGFLENNPTDMDPLTTKAMLQVFERNKAELKKQRKSIIKIFIGMLKKMNPAFIKFLITSIPKAVYGYIFPTDKVVAKAHEHGKKRIRSIEKKRKNLKTKEEKLNFIIEELPGFFYFVPLEIVYYIARSFVYLDKAKKIIYKHIDEISDLKKVEKALPNNITTEMGLELMEIAKKLDLKEQKANPEIHDIKKFLDKYGHRSSQEVDIGVPRWKEESDYIINLINSHIKNKTYQEGIENFYDNRTKAEDAIQNISNKLREKGASRDARRVEKLLKKYREVFGVREYPKFILRKAVAIFREIMLEVGEELENENLLDAKEDIFFLNFIDIESENDLKKLIIKNKEKYQKELLRTAVPRVITSTGETIYSPVEEENDNTYIGIPVSPGVYEGIVKILNHPDERAKLKKGEILVTKATNPAWTPLFLEIGGLIMEMGGPMSHGSVVAREYGVPAIAGINEATKRLEDGQKIRINGESGKVDLLS